MSGLHEILPHFQYRLRTNYFVNDPHLTLDSIILSLQAFEEEEILV